MSSAETDNTAEIAVDPDARHNAKMAKKKAARDKIMAGKAGDKGLILVHTGTGKGKSSSGFGMILRCVAHEMPCAVVQFIKGAWDTGERRLLTENFSDLCEFHAMGEGFTWETQDRARDIAAAQAGWAKAKELIRDPDIRFVLLDEIIIAMRYDYISTDEVIAFLKAERPPLTHVCLTGRGASEALIEAADLVTEMTLVKHPFRSGIKAQPGVEFLKLIAWDFDGVLNKGHQGGFHEWQSSFEADLGVSATVFTDFMFGSGLFTEVLTGKRDLLDLLAEWKATHAVPHDVQVVLDYWLTKDANPDMQVLGWLDACGIPGVIATNNEQHRARFMWEKMGFHTRMRHIFASGPLGVKKPDAAFFAAIEAWAGLDPAEILLIDDAEKNIIAAAARGWQTFHFTDDTRDRLPEVLGLTA